MAEPEKYPGGVKIKPPFEMGVVNLNLPYNPVPKRTKQENSLSNITIQGDASERHLLRKHNKYYIPILQNTYSAKLNIHI
ncbi:hypothetical protein J4O15_04560 [Lachnoanaerobaculum sp. Marseille-Q4761]|uniref:hypothetical protein n=1 Tax=Lachnoanaerobaculum sp. Marseille-Q4761 TaxID=2819511 RepID=UPI001AA1D117|nr:hypothetical protein [Lachnoanaerobaculum sp. Marseille-Q4761]MBO1870231.1 hypothetical protein [Lachnoanaerobaculum sp. Marseille-Q4761]